jgi:drug/metabolite transporter (DMT)-like permease
VEIGAGAGFAGGAGVLLLYRGLASGAMTLVAPVTAVTAAVLPLVAGLALDRWPGTVALAGVGCAIVAIGLVSLVSGGRGPVSTGHPSRLIGIALAAGAAFGLFYTLLGQAGDGSGLWPLVGAQLASTTLVAGLAWRRRVSLRLPGPALRWAMAAGVLDMVANAFYLFAVQQGLLSVVAPVASLYPVSTVLLALTVDRERLRPVQVTGLGLAATALVLVAGAA